MDMIAPYLDRIVLSLNFHLKTLIQDKFGTNIVHCFHLPDEDQDVVHVYFTFPKEYEAIVLREIAPERN
jgi:hypothetical protein